MTRIVILCAVLSTVGCGDNNKGGGMDAGTDLATPTGPAIEVACADTIDSIYADPGTLPADKGAIIHCAKDKDITANEIQALLTSEGTTIRPVTSGAHVYRILYRTERGDAANTPAVAQPVCPGRIPVVAPGQPPQPVRPLRGQRPQRG